MAWLEAVSIGKLQAPKLEAGHPILLIRDAYLTSFDLVLSWKEPTN